MLLPKRHPPPLQLLLRCVLIAQQHVLTTVMMICLQPFVLLVQGRLKEGQLPAFVEAFKPLVREALCSWTHTQPPAALEFHEKSND